MICGALQTLNEEACEDVLEETEDVSVVPDRDIPQTSVIPPSPDNIEGESQKKNTSFKSSKASASADKPVKKVTYVDGGGASCSLTYIEPTITILEPQTLSTQSVKYTQSADDKFFGDGDIL